MYRQFVVALVGVALALLSGPAGAHGDLQATDPDEGARLNKAPGRVSLTLTEAPGPGTQLEVVDGCKRSVAKRVSRKGSDLRATISAGEPGRWAMRYRAVSSVDGHVTRGTVRFVVRGKVDCSTDEPDPDETGTEIGGGASTRVANDNPPDEGGEFPLLPLAIGTVVLVGLALLLRASTAE